MFKLMAFCRMRRADWSFINPEDQEPIIDCKGADLFRRAKQVCHHQFQGDCTQMSLAHLVKSSTPILGQFMLMMRRKRKSDAHDQGIIG
ncbi:hypothetical protein HPP92_008837 [Vanilla planifolia]|uniref:Uncharacterized protein n=1 Tax=Vanilla planifolia TaxID=51239 RepID=A0A835V620_VANPL|nr:hypothetical protein HPP92_008837 [Vanilla planifolia]